MVFTHMQRRKALFSDVFDLLPNVQYPDIVNYLVLQTPYGFQKKNKHCLIPLEWCTIYQTFLKKLTVQATGIVQIRINNNYLLSFVKWFELKYFDFLVVYFCLRSE